MLFLLSGLTNIAVGSEALLDEGSEYVDHFEVLALLPAYLLEQAKEQLDCGGMVNIFVEDCQQILRVNLLHLVAEYANF